MVIGKPNNSPEQPIWYCKC